MKEVYTLLTILLIAILAESVWETLKMTWQNGKVSVDRVGALVVGMILAIGTKLDVLELIGITTVIPFLGVILTGILISRGSNFIHDLIVKLSNNDKDLAPKETNLTGEATEVCGK